MGKGGEKPEKHASIPSTERPRESNEHQKALALFQEVTTEFYRAGKRLTDYESRRHSTQKANPEELLREIQLLEAKIPNITGSIKNELRGEEGDLSEEERETNRQLLIQEANRALERKRAQLAHLRTRRSRNEELSEEDFREGYAIEKTRYREELLSIRDQLILHRELFSTLPEAHQAHCGYMLAHTEFELLCLDNDLRESAEPKISELPLKRRGRLAQTLNGLLYDAEEALLAARMELHRENPEFTSENSRTQIERLQGQLIHLRNMARIHIPKTMASKEQLGLLLNIKSSLSELGINTGDSDEPLQALDTLRNRLETQKDLKAGERDRIFTQMEPLFQQLESLFQELGSRYQLPPDQQALADQIAVYQGFTQRVKTLRDQLIHLSPEAEQQFVALRGAMERYFKEHFPEARVSLLPQMSLPQRHIEVVVRGQEERFFAFYSLKYNLQEKRWAFVPNPQQDKTFDSQENQTFCVSELEAALLG